MPIRLETDFNPIPDQECFLSTKKLNAVPSTRRAGKTAGKIYYANLWAVSGLDVALVEPDFSYGAEMFEILEQVLDPVIKSKSKQRFTIRTVTGGRVRFFSYEAFEKLRGKKLHKVIFDEFQMFSGDMNMLMAVLLPALADYHGQAWFFGTPRKNTPIEALTTYKGEEWAHYSMAAQRNPYITSEEIETQRKLLDPLVFAQEWEGQFVDFSGEMWLYDFKRDIHLVNDIPIDPYAPLMLCFDFNVDPCTCLVKQTIRDSQDNGGGINFIKEITAIGGTINLCKQVGKYIDSLTFFKGALWVTGDSSGTKADTRGTMTDYEIIRKELNIPYSRFVDTRKQNPLLSYSRDLCNTTFYNNLVYIDPIGCPILARDCTIAKPKEGSDNLVKDRALNKLDSFDAMRYGIHAEFKSIKDVHNFAKIVNN